MQLIDGKKVSLQIQSELKDKVEKRKQQGYRAPHLAAILVGDDPASHTYVKNKIKSCEEIGFGSSLFLYDSEVSEKEILDKVAEINGNSKIDGLIVQLPLPAQIDVNKVINTINPKRMLMGSIR
jgi:methylenetetrahydrofolate dehydrogenase (NADP+)/methenyltetrahydrofolate cyclohydrolase